MTQDQMGKMLELESKGWETIYFPNPPDYMHQIYGGDQFMMSENRNLIMVDGAGSVFFPTWTNRDEKLSA